MNRLLIDVGDIVRDREGTPLLIIRSTDLDGYDEPEENLRLAVSSEGYPTLVRCNEITYIGNLKDKWKEISDILKSMEVSE